MKSKLGLIFLHILIFFSTLPISSLSVRDGKCGQHKTKIVTEFAKACHYQKRVLQLECAHFHWKRTRTFRETPSDIDWSQLISFLQMPFIGKMQLSDGSSFLLSR